VEKALLNVQRFMVKEGNSATTNHFFRCSLSCVKRLCEEGLAVSNHSECSTSIRSTPGKMNFPSWSDAIRMFERKKAKILRNRRPPLCKFRNAFYSYREEKDATRKRTCYSPRRRKPKKINGKISRGAAQSSQQLRSGNIRGLK